MNTYSYQFASTCPSNQEQIVYSLTIQTPRTLMVEHIKSACSSHHEDYHEDIARDLHARFGGSLTLTATHHGVHIRTELHEPKGWEPAE